jgi:type I restriction enzyme S subunit
MTAEQVKPAASISPHPLTGDGPGVRVLPSGWRWARLGDICTFLDHLRVPVRDSDRQIRIAAKSPPELFPYYGANGQAGWIDDFIFDEELVLLAEDGGFFGSPDAAIAYRVSGKCWVNNHAHVLRAGPDVDVEWLHYSLHFRPDVLRFVSGTTRPKLNQDGARSIPIPLPPLPEQRRIATTLRDQLDAAHRAREAAFTRLEAARALTSAFLRSVFESEEAKRWPRATLGEICERAQYGYTASATSDPIGPRFLRITDIQDGRVGWDTVPFCRCASGDFQKYALKNGDILIARTGGTTGKSFLIENPPDAVFASYLIRVRAKAGNDPRFIYAFLQSDEYWDQIGVGMRGGAQPNVNGRMLEALTLSRPEFHRQRAAAGCLEGEFRQAEGMKSTIESELATIDALPQSLLRRAFAGEL